MGEKVKKVIFQDLTPMGLFLMQKPLGSRGFCIKKAIRSVDATIV
jgi:hypothetical protein